LLQDDNLEDVFCRIAENHSVYFFGSTAFLIYQGIKTGIVRVITSADLSTLARYFTRLQYDPHLNCNAFLIENDTLYLFTVSDVSCMDDFDFLRKSLGNRYQFFFNPQKKQFNTLEEGYQRLRQFAPDLDDLDLEDILDYGYLFSMMDHPRYEFYGSKIMKTVEIRSYLPLMNKILTAKNPYHGLCFLKQAGLLEQFFPFLSAMKGVEQDRLLHPEGDVFEHTLNCFQYIQKPSLRLAYGLLLHDFGKIHTRTRKGFEGHSTASRKELFRILKNFGFSADFIDDVLFLVENHMVNSYFFRIDEERRNRIFNQPLGTDLMKLYKADTLGSIGKLDDYQRIISVLRKKKANQYFI
jgi:hypothetical protein